MTDRHPTAADIAALGEDLLDSAEEARVRNHVTECAACADTVADLRRIRDELGSLYPEQPMPADLAARIDDALAAEPHLVSRETRAAPRRRMYMLAAAGAAVALATGGIIAQFVVSSGDTDVVADPGAAEESPGEGSASDRGAHEESSQEATGEAADEAALEADVRKLLAEREEQTESDELRPFDDTEPADPDVLSTPDEADEEPAPADEGLADDADPSGTAVPACVSSVIDRDEDPLAATDDYRHEGTSSYLVVLPHSDDPDVVDAYVVDASCDDSAGPASEDVLEQRSYPRDSP